MKLIVKKCGKELYYFHENSVESENKDGAITRKDQEWLKKVENCKHPKENNKKSYDGTYCGICGKALEAK